MKALDCRPFPAAILVLVHYVGKESRGLLQDTSTVDKDFRSIHELSPINEIFDLYVPHPLVVVPVRACYFMVDFHVLPKSKCIHDTLEILPDLLGVRIKV